MTNNDISTKCAWYRTGFALLAVEGFVVAVEEELNVTAVGA